MTKLEYALEKGAINKDESIFDIMKNTCVVEKHCLSCWTNIFYYKNRVNKGDKK
jgi:ferredoxin